MAKNKRTQDTDTGVMQIRLPSKTRDEAQFAAKLVGKKRSDWAADVLSKAARAAIVAYANASAS